MNWVSAALIVIAGLIAWAVWRYYQLDKESQAALKRRFGIYAILITLASLGCCLALAEDEPPIEELGDDYPVVLPGDQLSNAAGDMTSWFIGPDDDTWRAGATEFLNSSSFNETNLSYNSSNNTMIF